MAFCSSKDCPNTVKGARRYCDAHNAEKRPCIVQGCDNRLGVHNKSGFCTEHTLLSRERKQWLDD